MKNSRLVAILGMITVALSAIIIYYYYYFFMVPQYGMGGMMMHHMFSPTPSYSFLVITGLVVALVVSIVGLIYYALASPSGAKPAERHDDELEAVMKVLKPEERKVVEAIIRKGGRALQKEIRKETGLTRLKLHRIVQRLAERGIIRVREVGNTNELTVADWLKKEVGG